MKKSITPYKMKELTPTNDKGQSHGFWQVNWFSVDFLSKKSYHINGEQVGYSEEYSFHFGGLLYKTFSLI